MLSASMSNVNATAQRAPPGHGDGSAINGCLRSTANPCPRPAAGVRSFDSDAPRPGQDTEGQRIRGLIPIIMVPRDDCIGTSLRHVRVARGWGSSVVVPVGLPVAGTRWRSGVDGFVEGRGSVANDSPAQSLPDAGACSASSPRPRWASSLFPTGLLRDTNRTEEAEPPMQQSGASVHEEPIHSPARRARLTESGRQSIGGQRPGLRSVHRTIGSPRMFRAARGDSVRFPEPRNENDAPAPPRIGHPARALDAEDTGGGAPARRNASRNE